MKTQRIKRRPPHWGQLPILRSSVRFLIAFCGRRFGKTQLGIDKITDVVFAEPGMYWWVGLSWRSASLKRAWRLLKARFKKVPGVRIRESDKEIHLPNGSMIWMRTAENEDSLDGEGLKGVVVDECTLMKERVWTQHLRPALTDYRGWAVFLGVPKGMNWVGRLFVRGNQFKWNIDNHVFELEKKGEKNNWAGFQAPSEANPHLPIDDIREAEDELPDKTFRQEYMAELLKMEGAVFHDIGAHIFGELSEWKRGTIYYGGVDLARTTDYSVVTVMDSNGHIVFQDRFNLIGWPAQEARIIADLKPYKCPYIYADSTGVGDPIVSNLQEKNGNIIQYNFAGNRKQKLIENFTVSYERGEVSWPQELTHMSEEMELFEAKKTSGGLGVKYEAPDGLHDDCVISAALANLAIVKLGTSNTGSY